MWWCNFEVACDPVCVPYCKQCWIVSQQPGQNKKWLKRDSFSLFLVLVTMTAFGEGTDVKHIQSNEVNIDRWPLIIVNIDSWLFKVFFADSHFLSFLFCLVLRIWRYIKRKTSLTLYFWYYTLLRGHLRCWAFGGIKDLEQLENVTVPGSTVHCNPNI